MERLLRLVLFAGLAIFGLESAEYARMHELKPPRVTNVMQALLAPTPPPPPIPPPPPDFPGGGMP